ncbi:hypothetical protein [Bradyrhizobium sp.]|uniref:hypothetical protein n=1 Tax=Bradyrhizobium sp. TaxID=376 RepID=UPI0025BD8138|nr:hypothetical protein [Bradyrhizobium sp.]
MTPAFIQIILTLVGLAILAGLYFGYPGKGLRGAIIAVSLVIVAALVLAAMAP